MPPVRVLIVDDHYAFSEALRALLDQVDDIHVVGTAASGSEAIDRVRVVGADVVLMDVGLPGMDGLETTRRVLGIHPTARVIVLSGQTGSEARDAAIEAGDLTLVRGDLRVAADAIRLARRTLGTIHGNLFWAFGYNVAALPLAAAGFLNPMIAGAAMAFSSVFVVGNSLRLRRFRATGT